MSTSPPSRRLAVALSVSLAAAAGCATPTMPGMEPGAVGPREASARYLAAATSAVASATNGSYVAGRAVDGNPDTEWQSGAAANPTLTLDRGATGTLTALAIKANPNVATYKVEVCDDGTSWKAVLTNQKNTTWNQETKAFPAGTSGRYVRLSFTNGGKNVMVFEAQPQGLLVGPEPPAPSAPPSAAPAPGAPSASASATNGSYVAGRAIDGNADTEWQSGAVANPVLTIDRGAELSLAGLSIKMKPSVGTWSLEASSDGSTWTTVLRNQANTTWNAETKAIPGGVAGRFLRLAFANGAQNVMVFEVAASGTPVGASPQPSPIVSSTPVASPTLAPTPLPTFVPTPSPSSAPGGALGTRFGNQSVPKVGNSYTQGYALMKDLGMTGIREGWNWKYIETGKDQYVSWMDMYDGKMASFQTMGVQAMAMITDTPDWASSDPTYASKTGFDAASLGKYTVPKNLNAPIFADGTDQYKPGVAVNRDNYYAAYIWDLANRYKGKIGIYQVWNEPDYPAGDTAAGMTGSTGAQRYWAGSVQDYVRLLKVSHAIVKGVDPAAKIALGGLGYEKYLAAILDNGGAPYFDVVDFHAYGTDKTSSNGVLNSAWGFLGRYNAMKGVLAAKGVTGKTFSCSETGFTANNQGEQAAYVAKVFATGLAQGDVEAVQWAVFSNPGFNSIGLIDTATLSQKTQGYNAYKFATSQLTGATPVGALSGTNVQGFRFRRADGKSLCVAWSSASSASVTLPLASGQVLDKLGNAKGSYAGGTLALTADPVYVVGN